MKTETLKTRFGCKDVCEYQSKVNDYANYGWKVKEVKQESKFMVQVVFERKAKLGKKIKDRLVGFINRKLAPND